MWLGMQKSRFEMIKPRALLLQEQKYKEGCSLIQVAALRIVQASPQEPEPEPAAVQHRIAVQC